LNSDLKLHKFGAALTDCNQVLEADPLNVKALLRRGTAHQNSNNYEQVYIILCPYLIVTDENKRADWKCKKSVPDKLIRLVQKLPEGVDTLIK
jgi:hypothetical protein